MKNILIVIDVQNGFTRKEQTKKVANKIKELLEKKIFDCVIATRFLNSDNSIYEKLFDWKKLKSEGEIQLVDGLEQYMDYVVDKSIYTCINSNFIQKLCQLNDGEYPKQVFLAGVDTDCCVLTIATGLFEHNIRPIVLTKYCHSNGGVASHEAGLLCLQRLIGEKQLSNKEILQKSDLNNI